MADFELEDKHGNRYRIRQGAGPKFWHPENLGAGSSLLADNLLSAMPANGLQQAHNHFYFGTLHDIPNLPSGPQAALSTALSNSYLTIEKIGTALAINDDEPDPRNELRVKIRNALMAIVAGERAEAAMYQKQMDKETTVMKGVIYTGAFMQGVGSSAWGMVVWLKEVSDVVNPFVKMQHHARALQAAWESEDFTKTYSETYVKGEKRELVEALGFDPTQITEQQIDEAMAMANLVIEDPSLRDMLYQFVKDYAEAQHAIEVTNVAGTAAFELILTIIVAAVTGGVGVVAAVGSKAHLIKKFQKVGDLLSDFAKATRKLKLEGKKRKAKGNTAKFSDMETDQVQAKKTDAHGAEDGKVSKAKEKTEKEVVLEARQRQEAMLEDNIGFNVSPSDWDNYPTIGRNGSFISDRQGITDILGNIDGKSNISISKVDALQLEQSFGLEPGSLQGGFKIRQVDNIVDQAPRSPLEGNKYFRGPGQHLPGGAPEMVIDSISTTDSNTVKTLLEVNVKWIMKKSKLL